MARSRGHGGRRGHDEEHEDGERWLLTYADMITLLMALFMVLFSISSVNISKYRTLQQALKAAFSGQILPGGKALEHTGASERSSAVPNSTAATTIMPYGLETSSQSSGAKEINTLNGGKAVAQAVAQVAAQVAAQQEQASFQHLQQQIKDYAAANGLSGQVHTTVEARGLVISLLTDRLLFESGQASLSPASYSLLETIGSLLNGVDQVHPIAVEGNTDSVPISTSRFPSNWELSTARASSIVRFLIAEGVSPHRLSAIGYAEQKPTASNATESGRRLNRRVEIVLERLYPQQQAESLGEG